MRVTKIVKDNPSDFRVFQMLENRNSICVIHKIFIVRRVVEHIRTIFHLQVNLLQLIVQFVQFTVDAYTNNTDIIHFCLIQLGISNLK